jgi:hypothetical protein
MEINVSQCFVDFEGKELMEQEKPFTLKAAVVQALLTPFEDEKSLDGVKKFERGELASKIYNADGVVNLKAEEVTLAKELVAKLFSTFVVWQAWKMLDS